MSEFPNSRWNGNTVSEKEESFPTKWYDRKAEKDHKFALRELIRCSKLCHCLGLTLRVERQYCVDKVSGLVATIKKLEREIQKSKDEKTQSDYFKLKKISKKRRKK